MRFAGLVWRHVPAQAHPLHVGYILRAKGRWNRQTYGCLYTALTPEGALSEYRKRIAVLGDADQEWRRRDLVSLRVVVENVLDLTDTTVCKSFGISRRRICDDTEESLEACRIVADAARERGYVAIRAPSAADDREENLMIYIDIRADLIQLDVGSDRIPIVR